MKTALVVDAMGIQSTIDVESDCLKKLQTAVDGYIQPVDLTENLTMWVNEEFLLRDSFEPNLLGTAMYQSIGGQSVIMGTIVFTGGTDPEGDTMGLNDADYARLQDLANSARGWIETGTMN